MRIWEGVAALCRGCALLAQELCSRPLSCSRFGDIAAHIERQNVLGIHVWTTALHWSHLVQRWICRQIYGAGATCRSRCQQVHLVNISTRDLLHILTRREKSLDPGCTSVKLLLLCQFALGLFAVMLPRSMIGHLKHISDVASLLYVSVPKTARSNDVPGKWTHSD